MSAPVVHAGTGPRLVRAAVFTAVCLVLSATGHVVAACAPVPWWTLLAGFLLLFAVVAPLAGRPRSTATIVSALTAGQLGLHSLFGLGQQHMVIAVAATTPWSGWRRSCSAEPTASLSHVDAQRIVAEAGIGTSGASGVPGLSGTAGTAHGMAGMPGMDMHGGTMAMAPAAGTAAGLLPSLPMVLAHLLAALATGWLLRRGDLALVRIARLSARLSAQGIGEVRESVAESLTDSAQLRALRAAFTLARALLAGLPCGSAPETARAARFSYEPPPAPAGRALQHTVIRRGPPTALALAA